MKEMQFSFVGELPESSAPWRMAVGGGHVWFFSPGHPPLCLKDGELVSVVISELNPETPLIIPKAGE